MPPPASVAGGGSPISDQSSTVLSSPSSSMDSPLSPVLQSSSSSKRSSPSSQRPSIPRPDSPMVPRQPNTSVMQLNTSAPIQSNQSSSQAEQSYQNQHPRPDSPAPFANRPGSPLPVRPDSPLPGIVANNNRLADFDVINSPDSSTDSGEYLDNDDERYMAAEGEDRMIDMSSLDAIYSVQKMVEVLTRGPDHEKEFILFELQQLLDHCLSDTMRILLPVLCEKVPTWNIDLQMKSAERLYDVVGFDLEPATANMITCASFGVIRGAKGKATPECEELYNMWGSILVDCLPNMRWTPQEIKDVVGLVDVHAKETLYTSRKIAARVLGALSQCFDKQKVEKIVLPRAIELFEDADLEVRGTVVESMAHIGAALPIRITETEVWPRIEGLLEPPEEARLRATSMRTMSHILEAHREASGPSRLFRELLPPVFARLSVFARKYSAEDQRLVDDDTYFLLEVASEVFGQFVYSLAMFTRKSFRKEAYKAYAGMVTCNGPQIRRNCAHNLPGVAKALGEKYALELSGLCEYLAKDTDEDVRAILAAGIHETTRLLAPRGNFDRLFTAVCSLLQDESPMVRMNALEHLHDLMFSFAKNGTDPAPVRRLASVFTDLTILSEGKWRLQMSLAQQLGKCVEIIPSDALIDSVLPLLYRLILEGPPLVRETAIDATIKCIRKIPDVKDRNNAISEFWAKNAHGLYAMRLTLIHGGVVAMEVFSKKRFAELFASTVLKLADDPVSNVRLKLAPLLARIAPICMDTPEYKNAVSKLMSDKDIDVKDIMRTHNERVKQHVKEAHSKQAEDQEKYREEQEFYGFAPRAQKRARGRMNSGRGNRIMMHVRRPSLDQSGGQLSVSKAVITAAKASSAAASIIKPAQHPKLAPADSAVYLPETDHDEDMSEFEVGTDQGNTESVRSDIPRPSNSSRRNKSTVESSIPNGLSSNLNGQRPTKTPARSMNQNVPVVRHSQNKTSEKEKAARHEARSKSWNGRIAQLPRQLSMESRARRNASGSKADQSGNANGWSKNDSDTPKKTLSSLRKRRKKRLGKNSDARTDTSTETDHSTGSAEEYNITGARGTSSRNRHNSGRSNNAGRGFHSSDPAEAGDFTSMGSIEAAPTGKPERQRMLSRAHGRSVSLEHRSNGSYSGSNGVVHQMDGPGALPIVFESENGISAYRGSAPWERSKDDKDDSEHLIDGSQHKRPGGTSHAENQVDGTKGISKSVISSFHSSKSKMFGSKNVGAQSTMTSLESDSTIAASNNGHSSNTGGSGGGFFKGLFRRRR